jgi:hypothetical protein
MISPKPTLRVIHLHYLAASKQWVASMFKPGHTLFWEETNTVKHSALSDLCVKAFQFKQQERCLIPDGVDLRTEDTVSLLHFGTGESYSGFTITPSNSSL